MCPGFQLLIFLHLSCRAFLSVCVYKCTGASISAILLRSSKSESGRKFLHHRLSHISVKEQNQIFILNTSAQWHVCCPMQTSSWMAAFVEQSCEVLRLILASSPSPMTIREGGMVGGGGGVDGVVTWGRGRSSVTLRRRRLSATGIPCIDRLRWQEVTQTEVCSHDGCRGRAKRSVCGHTPQIPDFRPGLRPDGVDSLMKTR